jgi:competence protein ComEA
VSLRWPSALGAAAFFVTALTAAPGDELPDGDGKKILMVSCTTCHDLTEVTKLRGYYTRAQWRDVVVTMKEYGATVDEKQVEVLADYLAEHLGRK